jgi:pimeloyl-ACP methyl ester carboxylesterase
MNTRREFLKASSLLALVPAAALGEISSDAPAATSNPGTSRLPGVGHRSISGQTIKVNGVNYHVGDQGRGDKVVLLLHGMPDTSAVWRHQTAALQQAGYRVIVPDMLGYGETDKPQDAQRYTGEQILGDLVALLDSLRLPKVDIVGHDWGAFASWELVLNFPDRFRRHVAISVGHPDSALKGLTRQELKDSWYMYLNTMPGAEELYACNDGAFFLRKVIPSHPETAEVWSRIKDPRAMNSMLNWDRANPMSSQYLAAAKGTVAPRKCSVPTLGIWSSGDAFLWESQVKQSNQSMAAEWRYQRIDHASHWVMLEQPEILNRSILSWLSKS